MPGATIGDFPLELVEKIASHLDVKDVLKLMMVNKRLYAMGESIVFGKHPSVVSLGECSNSIKKFIDSPYIRLNATLLPFVKRIDSCDKLHVSFYAEPTDVTLLKQWKSVNQLKFYVDRKERCLKFLNNFRGSVKKNATLCIRIDLLEKDQGMKEQLGKFIENQLNGCEKIRLDCDSKNCFHVYNEAMMKTQIKMITMEASSFEFDKIVEWIVNQGIPSKNPEAVIHIVKPTETGAPQFRVSRINRFISKVQGLQRVDDDENHSALVSRANQLLRENDEDAYCVFETNSSCFRRRIDTTMSCIYVLYPFVFPHRFGIGEECWEQPAHFLAFYMPSL